MLTKPFSVGLALLLAACARQSSSAHDPNADRAAVTAAMEAYVAAIRNNNAPAISGLWAEDAVYMAPQTPTIRGHAALDSLVRSHLGAMRVTEITVRTEETIVDQDFAFQLGTYAETLQPQQGTPQAVRGRFLFVWRRQSDGTWKVARGVGTDPTGS